MLVGFVVLFLVLNWAFIWGRFSEWGLVTGDLEKVQREIQKYTSEISRKKIYETHLKDLEAAGAAIAVEQENQGNKLQSAISTAASANGVTLDAIRVVPSLTRGGFTNLFFDEVVMNAEIKAGEKELVDFLYSLGTSVLMIRVRDVVNLRLDPTTPTRLAATLSLVASFQKKSPTPPPAVATNALARGGPAVHSRGAAATNKPPADKPPANKPSANKPPANKPVKK